MIHRQWLYCRKHSYLKLDFIRRFSSKHMICRAVTATTKNAEAKTLENQNKITLNFEDLECLDVVIPKRNNSTNEAQISSQRHTSDASMRNQNSVYNHSEKSKKQPKNLRVKQLDSLDEANSTLITDNSDRKEKDLLFDRGSITENNTLTDFYQNIVDTYKEYSNRPDGTYIVLFHVGSFYELYFEQADQYSAILGLTLTKKNLKNGPISFSGFPDRMLDKYMDIIYNKGYKAVICNQVVDLVTNTISRPVDRIMTPGIVIDESCRDFHRNNYLMSLAFPSDFHGDIDSKKIGVSWCDVSLGLFYVLEITFSQLLSTITRVNPSEILISDKVNVGELLNGSVLPELVDMKSYYVTKFHGSGKLSSLDNFIWRFSDNPRLVSTTLDKLTQKEKSSTALLLQYLEVCLPNYKTSFQLPTRSLPKALMQIDSRVAQDLELLETLQSRKKVGALSHIMDKTVTNPGARLLNTWLLAPSTDLKEIKKRHDLLAVFKKDTLFLDSLKQHLKNTADVSRILRRIDNSKADNYEYLELAKTIGILDEIYDIASLQKERLKIVNPVFEEFKKSKKIPKLLKKILNTIDPKVSFIKTSANRPETEIVRDFWEIKDTASKQLKSLRKKYDALVEKAADLKQELQEEFKKEGYNGSINLIRDLKSYEYVIELKSTSKIIPNLVKNLNLVVKDRSKSVTKLLDPRWREIGIELIALEDNILLEETQVMRKLNSTILSMYDELRNISPIIEILDVTQSFAHLALAYNLIRPQIDNSGIFEIEGGRHLVVEEGLKYKLDLTNFTSNDCSINSSEAWVITGPNMGGKSTFLRQNALIAILCQIGCYVPADKAHIGVIDKIFTRVGSSDNIFKHQSTFMVEMNETAVILREATERSLVIVDELGRGTSTNEGVAIAYAALFRLLNVNKCKVLFATHFGPELLNLIHQNDDIKKKVAFFRTSLLEVSEPKNRELTIDQKIAFDHKLRKGISSHSHALKIAEIAGFPKDALAIAQQSFQTMK